MRDLAECQGLVAHVRADHGRIRRSVQSILRTLRQVDPHASRAEITIVMIEPLTALLAQLRRHFAEEEDGGSLDDAVCHCPSLAREVRQSNAEHPKLLAYLETLIARLRDPALAFGGMARDQQLLEDFAQRLRQHEAAENRLLSQAFGGSFGDDAT
jgi:hypothetical protein